MSNKIRYISILNILSCFAVVMLHTNSCFWNFSYERYWWTANIIESIMYFAVPIFFMITGVTLLDYREKYSTKEYFMKRIKKTLIPFFVWSFIGLIYIYFPFDKYTDDIFSVSTIIDMIMNTKIIGIYWFFIPLFSVYLSIPVLSAIPKKNKKSILLYLGGYLFLQLV